MASGLVPITSAIFLILDSLLGRNNYGSTWYFSELPLRAML